MQKSKGSNSQRGNESGQSSLHFGRIQEVFPNGTARVRLEDQDNLITMPIPVLHHGTDTRINYLMPVTGQRVAVMMDARMEQGCILGGIYSEANTPPIADLNKFHFKFGAIEITGDINTGVVQIACTRLEITNTTESTINGIPIVVVGAPDSDDELSGVDYITDSNQF